MQKQEEDYQEKEVIDREDYDRIVRLSPEEREELERDILSLIVELQNLLEIVYHVNRGDPYNPYTKE